MVEIATAGHHHQDRVQEVGFQARRLDADLRGGPGGKRQGSSVHSEGSAIMLPPVISASGFQRVHQHHVERQQVIDREQDQHQNR
jgi:hypothetical protein